MTLSRPRKAVAAAVFLLASLTFAWWRLEPLELEPVFFINASLEAELESMKARLVVVTDQLERPWSLAFLPSGEILVTERPGRLRLVSKDGTLQSEPLSGVPAVMAEGQGGLFEVLLHPRFGENRWVYLSYAKPGPQGATTAVMRGKLGPGGLEETEEIFVADAWGNTHKHFGARLVFDRDGYLYVTVGDRGTMKRAQETAHHAGQVLRLHDDGRAVESNPFVGRPGFRPETFSYGHRNPQGLCLHPETGQLWESEHGPRGGDEVNIIKAGADYGWPKVTFGINYNGKVISEQSEMEGVEPPLLHWTPSIAPCGLMFYNGSAFPQWKGHLFSGALAQRHVRRVRFDGVEPVEQEELLRSMKSRIRAVHQGPDGCLYLLTDSGNGRLLRLEPATP